MREHYLYNGGRAGLPNGTFWPKGKQYSFVTWYRIRKGSSDHGYEVNLLLASTFWSRESTNMSICWWCRNAPLPIQSMPCVVQNCSLACERDITCVVLISANPISYNYVTSGLIALSDALEVCVIQRCMQYSAIATAKAIVTHTHTHTEYT